jgi:hypothetical protein
VRFGANLDERRCSAPIQYAPGSESPNPCGCTGPRIREMMGKLAHTLAVAPRTQRCKERDMLGHLYDQALSGERCWVRHEDGRLAALPAHRWLGTRCCPNGTAAPPDALDEVFDEAVTRMCNGPTIELGCGPGRLVARLFQRGIPALGIDRSAVAVRLAGRGGAPALLRDVFAPLPAMGQWQTVLLVDSACDVGPWFRWATVGVDSAASLAAQAGLTLTTVRLIGDRMIASLAAG